MNAECCVLHEGPFAAKRPGHARGQACTRLAHRGDRWEKSLAGSTPSHSGVVRESWLPLRGLCQTGHRADSPESPQRPLGSHAGVDGLSHSQLLSSFPPPSLSTSPAQLPLLFSLPAFPPPQPSSPPPLEPLRPHWPSGSSKGQRGPNSLEPAHNTHPGSQQLALGCSFLVACCTPALVIDVLGLCLLHHHYSVSTTLTRGSGLVPVTGALFCFWSLRSAR